MSIPKGVVLLSMTIEDASQPRGGNSATVVHGLLSKVQRVEREESDHQTHVPHPSLTLRTLSFFFLAPFVPPS